MTDFPTSNSRRPKRRKPDAAGPVIGGILVFLWAFIFSIAQTFTTVTGTANMPMDMLLGIGAGLLGGLAGAFVVWLILYIVFGGRRSGRGTLVLALLAGVAVVGAVPVSGFRVLGAGMAAETDAVNAVRAQVNARRDAQVERGAAKRDALINRDFFEAGALGEPGGLARARAKLQALRALLAETEVEDERLQAQARGELGQLPVSGPRRRAAQSEFDAAVVVEREESGITAELSRMLFDEMEAQLDVLARTRWSVEYGRIMFTTAEGMTAFNTHAVRIEEISRELDGREQARQQRLAEARSRLR